MVIPTTRFLIKLFLLQNFKVSIFSDPLAVLTAVTEDTFRNQLYLELKVAVMQDESSDFCPEYNWFSLCKTDFHLFWKLLYIFSLTEKHCQKIVAI